MSGTDELIRGLAMAVSKKICEGVYVHARREEDLIAADALNKILPYMYNERIELALRECGLAEVIEALEDARKFIRGGHSTISYGPMALVEKIDAALATLRSLEYIDNAKKNTKTKN